MSPVGYSKNQLNLAKNGPSGQNKIVTQLESISYAQIRVTSTSLDDRPKNQPKYQR